MLELQFEAHKYKQIVSNANELTELDKSLLIKLITDYYAAKAKLKFSDNWQYNFVLTENQQSAIDAIALSPKYSFQAKRMAQNLLKQTFVFENCNKG